MFLRTSGWFVSTAFCVLAFCGRSDIVQAQTTAVPVSHFLNSLGVCTHISQGADNADEVESSLSYLGIHHIRDDGSTNPDTLQDFIDVYNATGTTVCLLPIDGDIGASISEYETLAGAHALLAVEGPNEMNNNPVTYEGATTSDNTTFLPGALFQRDLYAAVKADAALAGIPVFAPSEAGGPEPDDVGLQFLTIPAGSGLSMPDGTVYGDYANTHNYICANLLAPINNTAWQAEESTLNSAWDGTYGEYGITWRNHFDGYPIPSLNSLPKVTTETGWQTTGANSVTQDQQGKLFLNLYLDAWKEGWSYTFIYMLKDDPSQGDWGLVNTDYTPKLSGTYLHNFTTILADTAAGSADSLSYSIPNEPATVHDLLLEKSNGTFELAVWDENVNATLSGTDTVTVNFGAAYPSVSIFDPTVGTVATQTLSNVSSTMLTLSDHPLIIAIPQPSPAVSSASSVQVHGAAGTFPIPLALTGTPTVEPRIGSTRGSYRIVVNFTVPITSVTATLGLQSGQTGTVVGTAQAPTLAGATSTVTIPLTGVASAQRLDLHLSGIQPGNGTADIPLNVLYGDVNGDGVINILDLGQIKLHSGQAVGAQNFQYDINCDGTINILDLGQCRLNSGTSLP